jgi:hypothetical protein
MVKPAKVGQWIKVDGTIIPVLPSKGTRFELKELQDMVGGYVERVKLPKSMVLIANEDGHPMGLPPNPTASQMTGLDLVGDVVLLPRGMGW